MQTRILFLIALAACAFSAESHAQSTAFTYQGRLNQNGAPATGIYDLRFTIYDVAAGGAPVSATITNSALGVTNGLFTVLLDFGAETLSGPDRWLDIAVRLAGNGAFTTLNPRQPLTPTPYAIHARFATTASNVPGLTGNSLHAADGSPQDAVFVDNAGHVGIGTTSPQHMFDVRSGDGSYLRVDLPNGDLRVNGGSDGHWGIFNDGPTTGGTHLIGAGETRMFVANTGNVGIGTTTPAAKLDVRGDIRMGASGQLKAASGEENLRIIRGRVGKDGSIIEGSGFTVEHPFTGIYIISFNTPFTGRPTVTGAINFGSYLDDDSSVLMLNGAPTTRGAGLLIKFPGGTPLDAEFFFIAIGPR